jgi:hypothetical protein
LPFSNEGFAVAPDGAVTVGYMTTTDQPADPLASSFAVLLKGPLTELYALLWRAGVLEVGAKTHRAPRRAPENSDPTIDSDSLGTGSPPPAVRSRQRRQPGPVPTRPGGAPHSRAAG